MVSLAGVRASIHRVARRAPGTAAAARGQRRPSRRSHLSHSQRVAQGLGEGARFRTLAPAGRVQLPAERGTTPFIAKLACCTPAASQLGEIAQRRVLIQAATMPSFCSRGRFQGIVQCVVDGVVLRLVAPLCRLCNVQGFACSRANRSRTRQNGGGGPSHAGQLAAPPSQAPPGADPPVRCSADAPLAPRCRRSFTPSTACAADSRILSSGPGSRAGVSLERALSAVAFSTRGGRSGGGRSWNPGQLMHSLSCCKHVCRRHGHLAAGAGLLPAEHRRRLRGSGLHHFHRPLRPFLQGLHAGCF